MPWFPSTLARLGRAAAGASLLLALSQCDPRSVAHDRGLLASPGLVGQPIKGVYFFAGEKGANAGLYTTHPSDPRDGRWNSDPSTRGWVMDRMVAAHVNTVVMSDWSTLPRSSPMVLDRTSLAGVLDAVEGRPLVVEPALESGDGWTFADEFPTDANGKVAPGLVDRIGQIIALFDGRRELWAQMFDREGRPRYAVNVIHAASNRLRQQLGDASDDAAFAGAFDAVADAVEQRFGVRVGFTLDVIDGQSFSASPAETGKALERTASVLAIQEFEPEVFSGVVQTGPPCATGAACAPVDNNVSNLGAIADWKLARTRAWVATRVPVILSVSNGMDGRYVWAKDGIGYWGDNHDYTDDRFRNWVSEMKGSGTRGIVFDTWNGYTEGYAAVPSKEHGGTVYAWLRDLMKPDPRKCVHVHYENGVATHRVVGAICSKWLSLGGDRGFGAPVSGEMPTAHGRVTHFEKGAIYWSSDTRAHEVHGAISLAYRQSGEAAGCLGLPVADPEARGAERVSRFEHGVITWTPGERLGKVQCDAAPATARM